MHDSDELRVIIVMRKIIIVVILIIMKSTKCKPSAEFDPQYFD